MILVHMNGYRCLEVRQMLGTEPLGDLQCMPRLDFPRHEGLYDVVTLNTVRFMMTAFGRHHPLVFMSRHEKLMSGKAPMLGFISIKHIPNDDIHSGTPGQYFCDSHLSVRNPLQQRIYLPQQEQRLFRCAVRLGHPRVTGSGDLVHIISYAVDLHIEVMEFFGFARADFNAVYAAANQRADAESRFPAQAQEPLPFLRGHAHREERFLFRHRRYSFLAAAAAKIPPRWAA